MTGPGDERQSATLGSLREQFRVQRHHEFLTTAQHIVAAEGISALTMQRIADELDCAIGSIYRYFPSKNALLGELERTSLELLYTSLQLALSHLEDLIAEREIAGADAALARVMCASHFWIAAEQVFPQEVAVSRMLFTDPSVRFTEEDGARVLPAVFRVLMSASGLIDEATGVGALDQGASVDRAMIIIAGVTGVLLISGLTRWDEPLLDGGQLATTMVRGLVRGWGASDERLDLADGFLEELRKRNHLAPIARPTVG